MSCRKVKIDDGGGVDSFFSRKLIREDVLLRTYHRKILHRMYVCVCYITTSRRKAKSQKGRKKKEFKQKRENC